jgi:dihydrofolate reductase
VIRAYLASSLDGRIAGPGDDLSWLPAPEPAIGDLGFSAFLDQIGALLVGRRTWEVVQGFGGPLPWGERPVLVATHRALPGAPPQVQAAAGPIGALLDRAVALAGGRDVYVDGGELVRQALAAGRLDLLTLTVVPTALGGGVGLFDGLGAPVRFRRGDVRVLPVGLTQVDLWPLPAEAPLD